jgi:hypothetical protein
MQFANLKANWNQKGIKVSDEELVTLAIERDEFHGEWNYRLLPRKLARIGTIVQVIFT